MWVFLLRVASVESYALRSALSRLVCTFGYQSLVTVLTRCGLPLLTYFLADEKHSCCLTDQVYLPTIACGRVIWHLGSTKDASAAACTQSSGELQRAASQQEPSYRLRGILPDGFDSPTRAGGRYALGRLGRPAPRHQQAPEATGGYRVACRQALHAQLHPVWLRARQRKGLRVFGLWQR
jgi:hypothetical protein